MRSEQEVRDMCSRYERFNEAALKQMKKAPSVKDFDNAAAAFNHNGHLICALKWVLGEDTIQVKEGARG
jgi:hypothetical protein